MDACARLGVDPLGGREGGQTSDPVGFAQGPAKFGICVGARPYRSKYMRKPIPYEEMSSPKDASAVTANVSVKL